MSLKEFGAGFRPLCNKLGGLPGSLFVSRAGAGDIAENGGGGDVGVGDMPR